MSNVKIFTLFILVLLASFAQPIAHTAIGAMNETNQTPLSQDCAIVGSASYTVGYNVVNTTTIDNCDNTTQSVTYQFVSIQRVGEHVTATTQGYVELN